MGLFSVRELNDEWRPFATETSRMRLTIRAMQPDDWAAVSRIYQDGLSTGLASFETTSPSWRDWDSAHHRHSRLVACLGNRVVAWAALSPVSRRTCYSGVAEFSIYVAQDQRGQKIGRTLLQALIESSEKNDIWTLYSSTFPENHASLQLQTSCGFRIVGRREKIAQHHGIWRDTIITERRSQVVGVDVS